jgi:hypothetical protein
MKGLFAKYGNNVYLLNEEPSNCYQNIDVKERQINYRYSEANNEASVNINLGLINDDYKTNKEVVDDITTYLKENKILSIGTLEPFFEVAIDFILLSENKVLDEGVMVRHCSKSEAFNMFRILGTDAENEMHHRLIKYINIPFKFNYRESVPCGIMGNPNKQFVLVIRNIIVHEIVYDKDAYINGLNDRMDIFHKCSEGVAVTRETYKMNYKKPQDIVVFDAKNEGIELDPIYIENRFRNLTLKISIILNNYFITYDRDTILNIITENNKVIEKPTGSTTDSSGTEKPSGPASGSSGTGESSGSTTDSSGTEDTGSKTEDNENTSDEETKDIFIEDTSKEGN